MNILKVWDGEYPWDVRTEKVCRALTSRGHSVHMVARNRDHRVPREKLEECTVHRMKPWPLFGSSVDAASQFPAFFNPRWFSLMMRVGRAEGAELILVRDLPLAPTAILAGKRLGVPVVLDMAENYPAMIRDLWTTGSTKFGDVLVRNPRAVEAVERWTLARIDHVLVVVEESRDRLVAELGCPPGKVTVVGNTPSLSRMKGAEAESTGGPAGESGSGTPLEVVYLGLLEHARGVAVAIEAAALCRDRNVPVHFTIIGDGRAREDFEALVARLSLGDDHIEMTGFLPYPEALQRVASSEVGLIPHLANESWNSTIPNKLFDYMAAGLAVVTSDAKPARRVVEETGCGRWFRSGDAESLADELESLWRSGAAADYGGRGRAAIRARYNWEQEERRLFEVMESFASSNHSAIPPAVPESRSGR